MQDRVQFLNLFSQLPHPTKNFSQFVNSGNCGLALRIVIHKPGCRAITSPKDEEVLLLFDMVSSSQRAMICSRQSRAERQGETNVFQRRRAVKVPSTSSEKSHPSNVGCDAGAKKAAPLSWLGPV